MSKVLCVIDIQKEYITAGRPFCIPQIERSLGKAAELLQHARKSQWPVVHVQHIQGKGIFSKADGLEGFIEGFAPLAGETHVVKGDFSSFSSPEFVTFLAQHKDKEIVVVGYGSTMCCISTIIDGYHRGYKFIFATDAAAAKPTDKYDTDSLHAAACEILQSFCTLKKSADIR